MTVSAYNLTNGDVFDQEAARMLKGVCIDDVYFYTTKWNGYVYWLAGNIVVNGTAYALAAGNSGALQRDRIIIATLTDGANTAAISFITPTTPIPEGNKVIVGYVDNTSRLTLFNGSAQPNLSGYTLVKAIGDINVSGEGYLLSCSKWAYSFYTSPPASATRYVDIRLRIETDGTTIYDQTNRGADWEKPGDNHSLSLSTNSIGGVYRFNSNVRVTWTVTYTNNGNNPTEIQDFEGNGVVLYYIK